MPKKTGLPLLALLVRVMSAGTHYFMLSACSSCRRVVPKLPDGSDVSNSRAIGQLLCGRFPAHILPTRWNTDVILEFLTDPYFEF